MRAESPEEMYFPLKTKVFDIIFIKVTVQYSDFMIFLKMTASSVNKETRTC